MWTYESYQMKIHPTLNQMNPCKNERLYFFRRRKSIGFKRFRKSNNFVGLLEWLYTCEVCLTRKKKEVDATITEKFLSFSTSNNMTSSCSELNVFARFLKNEIMVMKLKLWIFNNPRDVPVQLLLLTSFKLDFCDKWKKQRFSSKSSKFHVANVKEKKFSNYFH